MSTSPASPLHAVGRLVKRSVVALLAGALATVGFLLVLGAAPPELVGLDEPNVSLAGIATIAVYFFVLWLATNLALYWVD